jgi:hypothetical protein
MMQRGLLKLHLKCVCFELAVRINSLHQCTALGGKQPLQGVFIIVDASRNCGKSGLYRRAPVDLTRNNLKQFVLHEMFLQ